MNYQPIVDFLKCIRCQKTKTAAEFNLNDKCLTGLDSWCKSCRLDNHRNLREEKREYFREANRIAKLKNRFNISKEQYEFRFEQQEGRCAICLRFGKKKLSVDHCHKTNKYRGLLCNSCNSALGFFGDSVESLQRAIDYLQKCR